jgi:hypothetical protein
MSRHVVHSFGAREGGAVERDEIDCTRAAPVRGLFELPESKRVVHHVDAVIVVANTGTERSKTDGWEVHEIVGGAIVSPAGREWVCPACGLATQPHVGSVQ